MADESEREESNGSYWTVCAVVAIALNLLQFVIFEATTSYALSFIIGLPVFASPFVIYFILCKVPDEKLSGFKKAVVAGVLSLFAVCLFLLLLVTHMAP